MSPGREDLLDGTRNSLAPYNGRIARATLRLVLSCLKFDAKEFEMSVKEQRQAQRQADGINFTGRDEPGLQPCPSLQRRSLEQIERWPRNRAQGAEP